MYSAIVTALYRRERTGKGSHVTTSLLAAGVWSCGLYVQAALCDAKFFPLHDRMKPPNAIINMYQTSDDNWFVLVLTPDKWPALAKGIGRPDLLTDPRFADPAKRAANSAELTAILDEVFSSEPMSHWREIFDQAHITFGVVHAPSEVGKDPQLLANEIIVPLEGAGGNTEAHDQQSDAGARCRQSACETGAGNRRTQRRGAERTGLHRRRNWPLPHSAQRSLMPLTKPRFWEVAMSDVVIKKSHASQQMPRKPTANPTIARLVLLQYGGGRSIDLDLDLINRTMYWTDRGAPPRGRGQTRSPMDFTQLLQKRRGNS